MTLLQLLCSSHVDTWPIRADSEKAPIYGGENKPREGQNAPERPTFLTSVVGGVEAAAVYFQHPVQDVIDIGEQWWFLQRGPMVGLKALSRCILPSCIYPGLCGINLVIWVSQRV